MLSFLQEKGASVKSVAVIVALFALAITLKYVSSSYFHAKVVETRVTIEGAVKNDVDFVMPHGYTILNLTGDACLTLCFSLIVSLFFIKSIEDSLAEKRRIELERIDAQIKENVISSVFGTLIEKEIFDVFKRDVITNGVFRKDAKWTYDFVELENGNIRLIQTDRYHLYNGTGEDKIEIIKGEFDNANGQIALKEFICKNDYEELLNFKESQLKVNPYNAKQRMSHGGFVIVDENEDGKMIISIKVEIKKNSRIHITHVFHTTYDSLPINDGFFTDYPLVNASLEANYPSGYGFSLFSSLSSNLVQDPIVQAQRRTYAAQGGILPSQGFVFTLKRLPLTNASKDIT